MRNRRLKKAIKKQARIVEARLRGESAKHLPTISWRERCAITASRIFAETEVRRGTPTPPEVLFHRYFRNRGHLLRDGYRGKVDLDRLVATTLPIALLFDLQGMLNSALLHGNTNIPGHVDHDPFHCDYLDSDEPN